MAAANNAVLNSGTCVLDVACMAGNFICMTVQTEQGLLSLAYLCAHQPPQVVHMWHTSRLHLHTIIQNTYGLDFLTTTLRTRADATFL